MSVPLLRQHSDDLSLEDALSAVVLVILRMAHIGLTTEFDQLLGIELFQDFFGFAMEFDRLHLESCD